MPSLSKILGKGHSKSDSISSVSRPESESSTSPPPTYGTNTPPFNPEDIIEPPDLTAGFSNIRIFDEGPTASNEECIAHLKLLECLYRLRQTVGSNDGLFDIYDHTIHALKLNDEDAAPLLAKLAEKRWAIYVTRAVDRFRAWQMRFAIPYGKITVDELQKLGMWDDLLHESFLSERHAPKLYLAKSTLPPIDILMVWHTLMLNPRAFLEDCLRRGMMHFWHLPFPLELVANAINSDTFVYETPDNYKAAFVGFMSNAWDNIDDIELKKTVLCPNCNAATDVVWSELIGFGITEGSLSDRVDEMLSGGRGYCESGFLAHCKVCAIELNHEYLKIGKLCRDIDGVRESRPIPLPGMLLGMKGLPGVCMNQTETAYVKTLEILTNLFRSELGLAIQQLKKNNNSTMQDVKRISEEHLKNPTFMRLIRRDHRSMLSPIEQNTFRRVMSRYWDNNTPFPLDLVGAVIRQCSFTEKMHNIDWLHSPALFNTISRLRIKYNRFLAIMSIQRGMAVPTLDVDLAWHTNQLNPYRYLKSTVDFVKQFVDHDDKVSEIKLSEAFSETSRRYQNMYKEPYSECTCWYCEAVRESVAAPGDRFFHKTLHKQVDKLHEVEQDPAKSVHISSHNAMRPTNDPYYARAAEVRNASLEAAYAKVCAKARSKGRKVPRRNDYYYSDAYGHPVYMLAYAPFVGYLGYTSILYASAPACMAIGSGGAACAAYAAGAGSGACACALGPGGCSSMAGSCAAGSCGAATSGISSCGGGSGGFSSCGGSSGGGGGGGCGGGGSSGGGGGGCGGGGGGGGC